MSVWVAVPVAPPQAVEDLEREAEKVITLISVEPFFAVGQFYRDFSQLTDQDVMGFLERSRRHHEK